MKKIYTLPTLLIFFIYLPLSVFGNNLEVTNISVNQPTQEVTFDVSWENSWRLDELGGPLNWDAAWLFVKFYPKCAGCDDLDSNWIHGIIDTTAVSLSSYEPHSTDGGAYYDDQRGIMIRQTTNGIFPVAGTPSTITLKIDNMPITGDVIVRVYGIEMVYIPEDTFEVGDGSADKTLATGGGCTPFEINTSGAITVGAGAGKLHSASCGYNMACAVDDGTIPASFPNGFDAVYAMKHEITEQMYGEFLNTLTNAAAGARYPGNYDAFRNLLDGNFQSIRPARAQNFLSAWDVLSFLDWAGLRPMTELEFEKIVRGPNTPVDGEYAWGTTNINHLTEVSTPEDGSEIVVSPTNATSRSNGATAGLKGGDGGPGFPDNKAKGPVRIGLFADPGDDTREKAGAAFYGVLDMTGNVKETTINFRNIYNTTVYDGTLGDGKVDDATGLYDITSWPTTGANYATDQNIILRGGGWDDTGGFGGADPFKASDRSDDCRADDFSARDNAAGGRGVR